MSIESPIVTAKEAELNSEELESEMVRVKMMEMVKREPTVEDFELAIKAVQELKEFAATESDSAKTFLKVLQVANKYFQKIPDGILRILSLGNYPSDEKQEAVRDAHLHMFDDCEMRLTRLMEKARALAENDKNKA